MGKVNVLHFEDGRVGVTTEGMSMVVNKQQPIKTVETEVEDVDAALANPEDFKENNA